MATQSTRPIPWRTAAVVLVRLAAAAVFGFVCGFFLALICFYLLIYVDFGFDAGFVLSVHWVFGFPLFGVGGGAAAFILEVRQIGAAQKNGTLHSQRLSGRKLVLYAMLSGAFCGFLLALLYFFLFVSGQHEDLLFLFLAVPALSVIGGVIGLLAGLVFLVTRGRNGNSTVFPEAPNSQAENTPV